MSLLVCDPKESERLIAERKASGLDRFDEVWEGVYVMPPIANNEHQALATRIGGILQPLVPWPDEGTVFVGVNISDRIEGSEYNYRVPDVAVFLKNNPARDCGTHWCGGPDWLTEIVSPRDRSRDKFDFYSKVAVREILIVDRDPWLLELYHNQGGDFHLVGSSTLEQPLLLASTVFPLVFSLCPGGIRPVILVATSDGKQQWYA
jgi:Uma2 family endonuclease